MDNPQISIARTRIQFIPGDCLSLDQEIALAQAHALLAAAEQLHAIASTLDYLRSDLETYADHRHDHL